MAIMIKLTSIVNTQLENWNACKQAVKRTEIWTERQTDICNILVPDRLSSHLCAVQPAVVMAHHTCVNANAKITQILYVICLERNTLQCIHVPLYTNDVCAFFSLRLAQHAAISYTTKTPRYSMSQGGQLTTVCYFPLISLTTRNKCLRVQDHFLIPSLYSPRALPFTPHTHRAFPRRCNKAFSTFQYGYINPQSINSPMTSQHIHN